MGLAACCKGKFMWGGADKECHRVIIHRATLLKKDYRALNSRFWMIVPATDKLLSHKRLRLLQSNAIINKGRTNTIYGLSAFPYFSKFRAPLFVNCEWT